MAGNSRFESSSTSSEELAFSPTYSNGQRGSYVGASLDRSGSFREGNESRVFNSGIITPRGRPSSTGDMPPLSHCLTLEPITIGDHKCTRSGELGKILGISSGTTAEDNGFGAVHLKARPQVVTEEIKRFKTDVEDVNMNARVRTKMFSERLNNLHIYGESLKSSKYLEVPYIKKRQRNMMLTNERSVGSNLLKAGSHIHRNPSDPVIQRLDEKNKNVVLNRRVWRSVAEIRTEGRGSNLARQSMVMGIERNVPRDDAEGSDLAEEKIRRLSAGGEGWDKKLKRKRFVGSGLVKSSEEDGEPKRIIHPKLKREPVLQSCDAQGFRSGSPNCGSRIKLDANSQPSGSNARVVPKSDTEKVSVTKDFATGLNKERLVVKGSKLNARDDTPIVRSTNMTKGKATRTPRSKPMIAGNSSPNFSRPSGSVEIWEQPPALNRIQSVSGMNRKRPLPAGSSSPPMAQWVGQRPQKISRTRRANLVSPVSNHDEVQMSPEGGASDIGSKLTSGGPGSSPLGKGSSTGTHNFKIKTDNVPSPAQFSESEESGAGGDREIRSKEKGLGSREVDGRVANSVLNVIPSMAITKKNKMSNRQDIGDGVRRQGRSGRASSFSRVGASTVRDKLESHAFTKPLRNAKPMSDKNGSKSGRPPPKKQSDRKVNRTGQTPSSSPDFTCESDDDREELIASANFACNASYLGCSEKFWKRKELVFSSVIMEDIDYVKQELSGEELHKIVSQKVGSGNHDPGVPVLDEHSLSSLASWDKDRRQQDQSASADPLSIVGQIQDSSYFCGGIDIEEMNGSTPLYQRVLSALITDDEMEEFEEDGAGRPMSFQYPGDNYLPNNVENRNREQTELGNNSILGIQAQKECILEIHSRNGTTPLLRGTNIQNSSRRDDFSQGNPRLVHPQPESFKNGVDELVSGQMNAAGICGSRYEHMCLEERLLLELQSVDFYPEEVPELADGEDEPINAEISKLEKELNQQLGKKKLHLGKLLEAAQGEKESQERALEKVAMDRLVELAYRKKLATRKSTSRCASSKAAKEVADAFMKRTLNRVRKYEETGKSCFSEAALRDVLLAPPPRTNIEDIINSPCSGMPGASDAARNSNNPSDQDLAKTRPLLNRGKKKEVLLDDVGGNSSLRFASSFGGSLSGGAKGKRSESTKSGRGERKTKTKPKQKISQLSTPGSIPSDNAINKRKDIRAVSSGNVPKASSNDVKALSEHPLHELDSIEVLGGNDDLSNILNFDDVGLPEDGLQEDDVMGLEIPMDDLADLNMCF